MQKMLSASAELADPLPGRTREPMPERAKGIALMCAAILIFSVLDTTSKYLIAAVRLPLFELVWLRFASQLIVMLALLGLVAVPRLLRSRRPLVQIVRSFLLMGSTLFNFAALAHLRLDQTVTISFMMPLLVALLAGPLLGEWVGWRRLLAIFTGFLGILVVIRPGMEHVHFAFLYSLAGTTCYALYNIATRWLAAYDPPEVTLTYGLVAAILVLAPVAHAEWVWPEHWWVWALIGLMGAAGGLGHYLLIDAHRRAPASILAPFSYLGLLSVTAGGFLVFGDLPDRWTLLGGGIVVLSGIYLFHREQVRREERRERKLRAQ
jgi:drug/metabolite transporter (DMT)-like permease